MNTEKNICEHLSNVLKAAMSNLRDHAMTMYPMGSHVEFTIMHAQKNASTGTVAGVSVDQYGLCIHIKHTEAKVGSRYRMRAVRPRAILSVHKS